MIGIKELRQMNEAMMIYLNKIGMDLERNQIINNILADEACFFKMTKDEAYRVLEALGVEEDKIYSIYLELTSNDELNRLIKENKLLKDELRIKIHDNNMGNILKK